MALKTMIANLNAARQAYEDQLKALGSDAQRGVAEMLAEHLAEGCRLHWKQYTPYFNDGEPCVFRVGEVFLVGPPEDGEEEVDWESDGIELWDGATKHYKDDNIPGFTKAQFFALSEAWGSLPEDLLKRIFGDHTEITVNSDGTFECSEYDHD